MKTNTLLTSVTAIICAVSFSACDKQPAAVAPVAPATNAPAASTLDKAKDMAGQAVDSAKDATAKAVDSTKAAATQATAVVKEEAAKATDAVKDTAAKATDAVKDMTANVTTPAAPATTDSATAQFTTVVANAKQFIADKNYQGALDELKKLSDVKLSDDQQKIVDGLKAEAQKLLSAGAGSAVDAAKNLMGK